MTVPAAPGWWLTDRPCPESHPIAGPFDTRNDAITAQSLAHQYGHTLYLQETP